MLRVLLIAMLVAVPALADSRADMRKAEIDSLLKALAAAPDETAASMLET
ncbi:MAG: hypothetical protein JO326_14320, partial [Acetobacteraceae bacterium]|nr:hypothetical protein [Acetobacteraceae bacterium]